MRIREAYRQQRESIPDDPYTASLHKIPENLSSITGTITDLRIYVFKSLRGLSVKSALLAPDGMESDDFRLVDRRAMLVQKAQKRNEGDPEYERLSQREAPVLEALQPVWDGEHLTYIDARSGDEIFSVHWKQLMTQKQDALLIKMSDNDIVSGVLENGPITERIREFLKEVRSDVQNVGVALRPQGIKWQRTVSDHLDPTGEATTNFSDGGNLHLTSLATLDYVNGHARAAERKRPFEGNVQMSAFRPNIVIDGWPANLEDLVSSAEIWDPEEIRDEVQLHFGEPNVRCSVTKVDPEKYEFRKDLEPLRTLRDTRPRRLGGPMKDRKKTIFGINVSTNPEAWMLEVQTGDRIAPLEERQIKLDEKG